MARKKPGRPTKFTQAVRERIVSAIQAGSYAGVAAEYAGVSRATFYRWLGKGEVAESGLYREFWDTVKKAESATEVRAVALIQDAMPDDWKAAMAFLERKYPERWGRRARHEVRVEVAPPATSRADHRLAAAIKGATDEELEVLARMLERADAA